MLVLSLFFMATSKIISTRPKSEKITNKHGYFECYMNGGRVMQKLSLENAAATPEAAPNNTCSFVPPKGISFVVIHAFNNSSGQRRFYTYTDPIVDGDSYNGGDKVTISYNDLRRFHELLDENEGEENGNDQINEFTNFLGMSHPSSSLYGILKTNNAYVGPAVFFGW